MIRIQSEVVVISEKVKCAEILFWKLLWIFCFFFTLRRVNCVGFDDIFDLELTLFSWHLNKSRLEDPEGSVCVLQFWPLANYLDLYLLTMRLILAISKNLAGSYIIRDLYHKHKWFILCHWNIPQRNREQSAVTEIGHQRQIKIAYLKVSFLFTSAAGYKNMEQNRYFEAHC